MVKLQSLNIRGNPSNGYGASPAINTRSRRVNACRSRVNAPLLKPNPCRPVFDLTTSMNG